MRPAVRTVAHRTEQFAELVCSNSLRSDEPTSAIGCLKEEMRALGSLVIAAADAHRVPAGKALAVDREGFSRTITERVVNHPRITVMRKEVVSLRGLGMRDWGLGSSPVPSPQPPVAVVVATGPLTAEPLARELLAMTQTNALYFYDSLAPLVAAETVDTARTFRASRYGISVGGGGDGADYINCPMDRGLYEAFIAALVQAEKVPAHDFEDPKYFEGCLPIEVMAERGPDTLRHGPMKPMGLTDPRTGKSPYAVVQLRQDNAAGTVYNIVGFQTRMKWPEQQRIFRTIPGLEHVEFLRLGAMHRNTYLNSPLLLDEYLRLKTSCVLPSTQNAGRTTQDALYFAGQITGVEGYVESAAMGLWVGLCVGAYVRACVCSNHMAIGSQPTHLRTYAPTHNLLHPPPQTTALGALIHHVAHGNPQRFEPNNAHWGLTPLMDLSGSKGDRKAAFLARARADFAAWRCRTQVSDTF